MNVLLLLPLGLAALAALLLPILLHLARRSEHRLVPFAALQWLRTQPQPRRNVRLEEWLLLLLRLLLLAAVALLLAQPVLFGRPDKRPYVAVATGVDAALARRQSDASDARWHRLAPGFPALEDPPAPATDTPDLSSLLRELDMQLPAGTPLQVIVPAVLDGVDAQRPQLSRAVQWTVVPTSAPTPASIQADAKKKSEPAVQLRYDPAHRDDLRWLRAAAAGWAVQRGNEAKPLAIDSVLSVAELQHPLPADTRSLIWLAAGQVPEPIRRWVAQGGHLLLAQDARWQGFADDAAVAWQDRGTVLARKLRHGAGEVVQLQQPLVTAAMPVLLEATFPQQLLALLTAAPATPARVDAKVFSPTIGASAWPEQPRPLDAWLAWLIAGLFLLERWLASGKRMRRSA